MAAPPPVFSDLFDDATKWDEPVPDYDALILLFGGVAGTAAGAPALYNRGQAMMGLANLALPLSSLSVPPTTTNTSTWAIRYQCTPTTRSILWDSTPVNIHVRFMNAVL